jgi:hypothetical protein
MWHEWPLRGLSQFTVRRNCLYCPSSLASTIVSHTGRTALRQAVRISRSPCSGPGSGPLAVLLGRDARMSSRAWSRCAAAAGSLASRACTAWPCRARTEAAAGCPEMVRTRVETDGSGGLGRPGEQVAVIVGVMRISDPAHAHGLRDLAGLVPVRPRGQVWALSMARSVHRRPSPGPPVQATTMT